MMIIPIPGYEGLYEISDQGQVYSLKSKIELKQATKKNGYKVVSLYNGGKGKQFLVHRLVMLSFEPNADTSLHVNHINFNKSDNSLKNLEYVTVKENINHSLKAGRYNSVIKSRMKKVNQIDLNTGKIVKTWDSVSAAVKAGYPYVAQAAYDSPKAKKTHKGYIWRYENE